MTALMTDNTQVVVRRRKKTRGDTMPLEPESVASSANQHDQSADKDLGIGTTDNQPVARPRHRGPYIQRPRMTSLAYTPHDDRWGTNHVTLVGRVSDREAQTFQLTNSSSTYTCYYVSVYEPHEGDDGANPVSTIIPIIVPRESMAMHTTFKEKERKITVTGRLVIGTRHDPRYATQSDVGGAMLTQPYVLASSAALTVGTAGRQQYAIGHIAGTITGTYRRSTKRFSFDANDYWLMEVEVQELFERPAPARGRRVETQSFFVLVPHALSTHQFEVGEKVQCEVMFDNETQWLGNNHYALQGVDVDNRNELRRRDKIYLIATYFEHQDETPQPKEEKDTMAWTKDLDDDLSIESGADGELL